MQSQAGDGSTFPKPGQKVTCHYVLTLQVQHGEADGDWDGGVFGHDDGDDDGDGDGDDDDDVNGDDDADGDDDQKVTLCSNSSGATREIDKD